MIHASVAVLGKSESRFTVSEGEYGLSLNLEWVSRGLLLKGTYISIIRFLYRDPNVFACSNINSQQMVVGFGIFSSRPLRVQEILFFHRPVT